MAKDKITEYDATANNNTVCGDVNIAENSALPSDMNNFAREIMSHLKEGLGSGTPLYVDQTNNRVGIGNSTPSSYENGATDLVVGNTGDTGMTVASGTSSNGSIFFADGTSGGAKYEGQIRYNHGSNFMMFATGGTERMRISNLGNVTITGSGTGSTTALKVNNTDSASFVHAQQNIAPNLASTNTVVNFVGKELSAKNSGYIGYTWSSAGSNSNRLTFGHYASDYLMNLTADGNLLVGKTADNLTDAGQVFTNGGSSFTRSGGAVCQFNRNTSNGEIIRLSKDGTTVGSIGNDSDKLYVDSNGTNLVLRVQGTAYINLDNLRLYPQTDNSYDLGISSLRFDDIFATNGTIQTSDQNEKNTITDSDLGIDFIKRLTPKSYIFNGKTRTHYGLIAQDVETVLTDINKPTSGFAGFIKSDISEEQDGSEYRYGLRYTEFVAPLIQAVKDQQATIDALTARITALENGE